MMGKGEEDVTEYESDPEETKLSLKMRRREASDDEDENEGVKTEVPLRRNIENSDNESSEGEGAVAVYEEEQDEEEEEVEGVKEVVVGSTLGGVDDGNEDNVEQEEEKKKENEPYAVPKAGAFYMHDDRFGDNVARRHKGTPGRRGLWESKDDRKWGHDKFKQLTVEERNYDEDRRISRGRYRGRGRIRGAASRASRGRRPKAYINVMQFGGQHPGGVGVPAVGMAFPGYVGQPDGLGNSKMTWLPVLAGAAGALGTPYCSPYIAADGAYHPRLSGKISSLGAAPIKENNTSKPDSELKPQQTPELTTDDFRLRQKNPRRYTEMKFDQ